MDNVTLQIRDMNCGKCVARVQKVLDGLKGITVNQVKIGSASIQLDTSTAKPDAVCAALTDAGYPTSLVSH